RKLGLSNGKAFEALLTDLRTTAKAAPLTELIYHCEDIGRRLTGANADDRLAASYPFLTMLSVAVCGWLMEQQHSAATDDDFGQVKKATAAFYLDQIVPEAIGLAAAASAPADQLYAIDPALLLA
ncbi:acyl-CoA dehydrogenase C-terminal domain-containing protein, partial [Escherichia coli]